MEGDMKGAVRYAGLYAVRLAIMAAVILLLCWYLLDTYLATLPSDPASGSSGLAADVSGLATRVLVYIPPLILTIPIAFVAGYFPIGSRNRLAVRMVLNVYLIIMTLFITSDLSFTLEDIQLLESPGIYADTISLSVDARLAGCILLLIPVCSMADAVLEHRYSSE